VIYPRVRVTALIVGLGVSLATLLPAFSGPTASSHAAHAASSAALMSGSAARPMAAGTVTPTTSATGTSSPAASRTPAAITTTVPSTTTGGDSLPPDATLLADENAILGSPLPTLLGALPLSTLPPITGTVAGLETRILTLTGRVLRSSLSATQKSTLLAQLSTIDTRLQGALASEDRVNGLRDDENALIQAQVDGQAGIDKLATQIQVNLSDLRANVESTVSSDIVASVGSISITVNGSTDTISATLGAQTDRLLVNVIADLDVLHVATLHATTNVDTTRLNVTLDVLVRKLTLDLNLLLTDLRVSVHADVSAAVSAEASLTVSLAAEVDGLKAALAADTQTKLSGLDNILGPLIESINGTLSGASSDLTAIAAQVPTR